MIGPPVAAPPTTGAPPGPPQLPELPQFLQPITADTRMAPCSHQRRLDFRIRNILFV